MIYLNFKPKDYESLTQTFWQILQIKPDEKVVQ